jgi:hypothetical protein
MDNFYLIDTYINKLNIFLSIIILEYHCFVTQTKEKKWKEEMRLKH